MCFVRSFVENQYSTEEQPVGFQWTQAVLLLPGFAKPLGNEEVMDYLLDRTNEVLFYRLASCDRVVR